MKLRLNKIPKNWKWEASGDIIDVRDGTHDTPKYLPEGIPLITSKNLKPYGIDFEKVGFISEEDHISISKRSHVERDDILFAMIGTIGNPVIVESDRVFSIKNVALFKCSKGQVEPRYCYRLLDSPLVKKQLNDASRGGTQKFVSLKVLRNLQIPLPPLTEQKRIAKILDATDALRTKRREALAQLDSLLQSTFLDMFGDPVANPMGWEVKPLGELGTLNRGISKHRPRNEPSLLGGPHPLIQTGEVAKSGGYIRSYTSTYSDLGLKQSKMWSTGTLCITIAANIANTGILTFDACFPDSVVGFLSEEAGRAEYVQGLFWFFKDILDRKAPQVAQKNINLKILRDLPVPLPPTDLQHRFATIVKSIEQQKARMQAHLTELDTLFAALQQRAFNGDL